METLDRNVLVLIVGFLDFDSYCVFNQVCRCFRRAGLPHFGQKIAEVHIKRPLLPFSDQECEKITKISFDLLTSSSSLMSRMPNVTNITIHCQNPFEQLELLGETVKAIKSESVVYFDVQSSYRLGLFQKGESIAQDESWDRYEVTAPLKPILRDFVLKQKTPVLHFHGFFEPCYILRTAEDQILGYCWINYCDGFPGWTRGLFAATALFFNGYTFIADKVCIPLVFENAYLLQKGARWERW